MKALPFPTNWDDVPENVIDKVLMLAIEMRYLEGGKVEFVPIVNEAVQRFIDDAETQVLQTALDQIISVFRQTIRHAEQIGADLNEPGEDEQ